MIHQFDQASRVCLRLHVGFDLLSNSVIRSRVRDIRLMVLIASTLEAFVKSAGAATNVSAANGLCANGVSSMRFPRL